MAAILLVASVLTSCSTKSQGTQSLQLSDSAQDKQQEAALKLALAGDYTKALSEAQRGLKQGSQSAEIYAASALAHLEFGHTDEALADANRACELRSDWALGSDTRALCLLEKGKVAQAEAEATKAVQLEPDNVRFLLHRAEIRNRLKETDLAQEDIQRIFSSGQLRGEALSQRAHMLDLEGRWSEAESSATEAIVILQKQFNAKDNRARKYLTRAFTARAWARNGLAKFYDAYADADQALKINPNSFEARSVRAWASSNLGRWRDAADNGGMLIALDPDAAHAYICRSWGRLGTGNPEYGLKDANRAVSLEPFNASANVARAASLCRLGHLDAAESDCSIAIKKNEDHVRAHLILSRILRARKNLDGSLKEIDLSIVHKPPAFYYLERANLQEERKKLDLALTDVAIAIKLEPDNPACYAARAAVLIKLKKYPQALNDITKAIQLDPNQPLYKTLKSEISKNLPTEEKGYRPRYEPSAK